VSDDTDQLGNDDDDGSPHVTLKRSDIRRLEKKANQVDQLQNELAQLRRDSAFREAGINPAADPRLSFFMKAYEGDYTADAIKAAATEAGFLQASPPPGAPDPSGGGPSPAEMQAMQRMQAATSAPQTPDVSMDNAFHTAMAEAQTKGPDAVMAVVAKFGLPTPGAE
jgi:hypothetical protein